MFMGSYHLSLSDTFPFLHIYSHSCVKELLFSYKSFAAIPLFFVILVSEELGPMFMGSIPAQSERRIFISVCHTCVKELFCLLINHSQRYR